MTNDPDTLAMDLCRLAGETWTKRDAELWRKRATALQMLADKRVPKAEATKRAQRIMRGGR